MGLAAVFTVGLIALAILIVMLWGACEALVRAMRFVWQLLTKPAP